MLRQITAALLAVAITGGALISSGAHAQSYKDEPIIVATPFSWTGFYAGLQLGYGEAGHDSLIISNGARVPIDMDGVFGGVHAGYNVQINQFVFGVEADYNFSSIDGTSTVAVGAGGGTFPNTSLGGSLEDFGSIRLRAGLAIDRLLVFATAGYAWGSAEAFDIEGTTPAGNRRADYSFDVEGFTAGAGLEYALSNNLTIRAEYRYYGFGGDTTRFADVVVGPTTFLARDISVDDLQTVSVGVSVKF